jgi:hypothetical protein
VGFRELFYKKETTDTKPALPGIVFLILFAYLIMVCYDIPVLLYLNEKRRGGA